MLVDLQESFKEKSKKPSSQLNVLKRKKKETSQRKSTTREQIHRKVRRIIKDEDLITEPTGSG